MVMCWVPGCKHYSNRETCRMFRFPKPGTRERSKWLKLIRRDGEPGVGAHVCSCHFRDGIKANMPEIFDRNRTKLFGEHYLSPERKSKKKKKVEDSIIFRTAPHKNINEPKASTSQIQHVNTESFSLQLNSTHMQAELPVRMFTEPYEVTPPEMVTNHGEPAASRLSSSSHFSYPTDTQPLFNADIGSSVQSNVQNFFSISSDDSPQERMLKNEIRELAILAETRRKAIRCLQQKIRRQKKKICKLESILNNKRNIATDRTQHKDGYPDYEFATCETNMDSDDEQNETDFSTMYTIKKEVSETSETETDEAEFEDTKIYCPEYLVNIKEECKKNLDDKTLVFETVSNINGDQLKICPKDAQTELNDVWPIQDHIKIEESPTEIYADRIIKTENDDVSETTQCQFCKVHLEHGENLEHHMNNCCQKEDTVVR